MSHFFLSDYLNIIGDEILVNLGAKFQRLYYYIDLHWLVHKSSPMIFSNQMIYSWNYEIISLAFCPNPNNFRSLRTKRAWNYSLISIVTIWLHILKQNIFKSVLFFPCLSMPKAYTLRNKWSCRYSLVLFLFTFDCHLKVSEKRI